MVDPDKLSIFLREKISPSSLSSRTADDKISSVGEKLEAQLICTSLDAHGFWELEYIIYV